MSGKPLAPPPARVRTEQSHHEEAAELDTRVRGEGGVGVSVQAQGSGGKALVQTDAPG